MSRKLLPDRSSTSSIAFRDSTALSIFASSSVERKRLQFSPNSKRLPPAPSAACVLISTLITNPSVRINQTSPATNGAHVHSITRDVVGELQVLSRHEPPAELVPQIG